MRFNLEKLKHIEFKTTKDQQALEKMRVIYPDATEQELREGLEALKDYLRIAFKIVSRLAHDGDESLTIIDKIPTIKPQRSNPTNNNQPFNNL